MATHASKPLPRDNPSPPPHLQVRLNQAGAQRGGVAALAARVRVAHVRQRLKQDCQGGTVAGGHTLQWWRWFETLGDTV